MHNHVRQHHANATTAQLNSAVAYSRQLENQEGYAVLRAEADGVIMDIPADVGQVVGAGNVVVRLAHDGACEAVVNLPEGTTKIANSKAVASLYADSGHSFPAKLRELSAMADPLTRTYQARFSLDGVGKNAPLGATVTVHLNGETRSDTLQRWANSCRRSSRSPKPPPRVTAWPRHVTTAVSPAI